MAIKWALRQAIYPSTFPFTMNTHYKTVCANFPQSIYCKLPPKDHYEKKIYFWCSAGARVKCRCLPKITNNWTESNLTTRERIINPISLSITFENQVGLKMSYKSIKIYFHHELPLQPIACLPWEKDINSQIPLMSKPIIFFSIAAHQLGWNNASTTILIMGIEPKLVENKERRMTTDP